MVGRLSGAVAAAAVAFLAFGCGDSPPNGSKPSDDPVVDTPAPVDLRASTDDAAGVRLEWSMPAEAMPTSFVVERDGEPIAEASAASRTYADTSATAGRIVPPTLEASRGTREDAVELAWGAATTSPGPMHSYRVVALYGDVRSDASEPAVGRRAQPGTIGFELQRDGAPIAKLLEDERSFVDTQAQPGSRVAPQVKGASLPEGASLTWDPPVSTGKQHRYRLRVSGAGAVDVVSNEASGFRSGPVPTGFEVTRDGASLATLPANAGAYLDASEPVVDLLPVTGVTAKETSGGIEVKWVAPSGGVTGTHDYRVKTLYAGGASDPSQAVKIGRSSKPTGYAIIRDGTERAILPASQLAWKDAEGDLELVGAPEVIPSSDTAFVHLRWGGMYVRSSDWRTYEVVALYSTARSEPVAGPSVWRNSPEIVGYRVTRDDGPPTLVSFPGYIDHSTEPGKLYAPGFLTATQGTHADRVHLSWTPCHVEPGPAHRYAVSVVIEAGEGPATVVEAGRSPPDLTGGEYYIYRDGLVLQYMWDLAQAEADDTTANAGPSTAPVLTVTGGRTDGVQLDWTTPLLGEGGRHVYELEMRVPNFVPTRTRSATGFLGTGFDGYEIVRDGAIVATLPRGVNSFLDAGALPVEAPGPLTATTTYADAVALSWTAPSGTPQAHAYQVRTVSGALDLPSQIVTGSRSASPVLGYEFSRDDGATWNPADTRTSYNDAAAPLGTIYVTRGIEITIEDPGGVVTQKTGSDYSGFGVTQPPNSPYRVRAVTAAGPGPSSQVAMGRRAASTAGMTSVWQRSVADADGPYVDVGPCCSATATSPLAMGEARWFRLHAQTPSAVGVIGTVRLERKAFTSIAAGDKHVCGLWSDGQLRCWGTYKYSSAPTTRPAGDSVGPYVDVAAGGNWTYATSPDGELLRLGGDTPNLQRLPSASQPYSMLAMSGTHACGLKASDDRVVCVGSTPPSDFFSAITAGSGFTCGIRLDGTLACWGASLQGIPTGTFSEIAAGADHVCGITTAGTLACWGSALTESPPTGSDWVSVRSGTGRSCAMRTDGTITCWGQTTSWTVPTGSFVAMTMGPAFACALDAGGEVECWGTAP